MQRLQVIGCAVVLGIGSLALVSLARGAQDTGRDAAPDGEKKDTGQRDKDLSHFMRLKLEASSKVLEGLAIEDFALIKEGAQQLNAMSAAEKWRISNDALYRNFSDDFQRVTADLSKAADEENLDRAALKWMDATMSCIECHRYARGVMIASAPLPNEVGR